MAGAIRVVLPPTSAHLAPKILEVGCTPVVDATGAHPPEVPEGAWVRTRPGRPAPGTGPVVLAELGAPVPDRPTWLETSAPRDVPGGFAGLVLKGREAGGLVGEQDGLEALAACPHPERVLLDAGVGPATAAAAAALGAAGVLLVEPHLGCPEIELPPALERRLHVPDDEVTVVVAGLRVANAATAPILRQLTRGADLWALAEGAWAPEAGPDRLWLLGQGLALAAGLAERHGTLAGLLEAYNEAWTQWRRRARSAVAVPEARTVFAASTLGSPGTAAGTGGAVGSAVLWQEAAWLGRPVRGPLRAAAATGCPVVAPAEALDAIRPPARTPQPEAEPTDRPVEPQGTPAIAIIGIGCRFPGARNTEEFWSNIVGGVSAIGEVTPDRWDPSLYYDADPAVPDMSYSRIGGFIHDFVFDSRRFRIPPRVARQVDPVQQITLTCVADALEDAGLKVDRRSDGREFDRERCAVILGNSLGGEVSDAYAIRLAWPAVREQLSTLPALSHLDGAARSRVIAEMEAAYKAELPVVDEDSMPGELANVIAGRIANAFDLGGANFTVDAACASSMAALQTSVRSLQDGDADLVVTGGADRSMNVATYVKFCKIGALSPDHSAPFDASANGFVMGEGCGILLLKRHEDAVRDGDRVYAVIRGIGASSDGKGKGITAPNIKGQIRALERAYTAAGIAPSDVDLIEAHGTSTVVGDQVEVEALNAVIGDARPAGRGPVRLGSVKSMIGHLKSAAGAASCIKASLALHHGIFPPSLGFQQARPEVALDKIPLRVQTEAEPWPVGPDGVRRAGVSAFGFGGTNFHVVLESYGAGALPVSRPRAPMADLPLPAPPATPVPAAPPEPERVPIVVAEAAQPLELPDLPEGIWATSANRREDLVVHLELLRSGRPAPFHPSAPLRIVAAARDAAEQLSQLDRAIKSISTNGNPDMLRARAVHFEDAPFDGQLALLFTGQGSQYVGMGLDLAEAYPIVRDTFAQADRILAGTLGRPLTDLLRLADGEDPDDKAEVLRQTEYSQPTTLTLDVAILRLLASYGIVPDVVAGHSLGEYGAAVAAGVMTFEQALHAVSARGREMAGIRLADPGKMAGIAASTDLVEAVLAEVDGYVIPANKNCPTQTVIAGASDAVDEAAERFRARGITVYTLPVSHAFHSSIVEPASEPLRGVLAKLGLASPRRPITTNVTGEYYPTGPGAVEPIIDLLAQQISSPVEWVAQLERMYADGARAFVECGPKRALSGFTVSVLKRRPHKAVYTNHPKRGGVTSFRDALASLLAIGFPVRSQALDTPAAELDLFIAPEPRQATTEAVAAYTELNRTSTEPVADVRDGILRIVARTTDYAVEELDLDYELEADLGIDTVKQAEVFSVVRSTYGIPADPAFSFSDHRTLRSLSRWAAARTGATRIAVERTTPAVVEAPAPPAGPALVADDVITSFLERAARGGLEGLDAEAFASALLPAVQGLLSAAFEAGRAAAPPRAEAPAPPPAPAPRPAPEEPRQQVRVVCSGASVGLPGGSEAFADENFADILSGRVRISHIGERAQRFLDMGIVRLVKDAQTGQGSFLPVEDVSQVIRLAGVNMGVDPEAYGIDASLAQALDITTILAFAAGLEALRDAGIPLVRAYRTTANGRKVPVGWRLPEPLRDRTGIVFASAFPGYDRLVEKLGSNGAGAEGHFDRRFLFQILSMGHSQFAQFIGARGPNTALNAACASTTQAVGVAADWIELGRCDRVLVLGADDVTSDQLLPWIGSGFMAAGAATPSDQVALAALPFDRRRHGLILGMGAVGLVLETAASCAERGVVPISEHLGTALHNSAFHGTRLDTEHIAGAVTELIEGVRQREGVSREQMAESTFFMSHETYTPARGGSAAAEILALRQAFGPAAERVTIANTKGYTGHAMGAGIEDAVAIKALQYGIVPPLPNLREPDPDLGALRLSRGERRPFQYALRLAAGFGSQLALTVWKRVAEGDERVADPARRAAWLRAITGYDHVAERIEQRTLRVLDAEADALLPLRPAVSPAEATAFDEELAATPVGAPRAEAPLPARIEPAPETEPAAAAPAPSAPPEGVLEALVGLIATKTGYEPDELEPDFELEADLGIDTVKQAEILSELTETFGLSRDDQFRISDYPTIQSLADYVGSQAATAAPTEPEPAAASAPEPVPEPDPEEITEPRPDTAPGDADQVLGDLIDIVAEKTGYAPDELEPDFELEADLGVDTVKQAEILSDLRTRYQLPPDDAFRLGDHPTLSALALYLHELRARSGAPTPLAEAAPLPDDDSDEDVSDEPTADRPFVAEEFDLSPMMTDEEQAAALHVPLPPSFRVRRPVLVARPSATPTDLVEHRVRVLGTSPFAEAVRKELGLRAAGTDAPHDVIIDVTDDVEDSFRAAKELDGARPRRWLTLTRMGGMGPQIERKRAWADGARAGFTKALGREWEGTAAKVVDVPYGASAPEAASIVCDEILADPAVEVFVHGQERRVVQYAHIDPPPIGLLEPLRTVLITGGGRGICARIAHEIASRGRTQLALVGRLPPLDEPLDERAEKERIKQDLRDKGERVTPARVERALSRFRRAEEVRATIASLRAKGAKVRYFTADLSEPDDVPRLVEGVRDAFGPIHVAIHGAGVEESRQLHDKDEAAFHRVFDGKAVGGEALVKMLPAETYFVSMGSVAGRFGNPGQVDYAAANDAMARLCLARPNSLHLDWTAWDDVGMAVRGSMRHVLSERGVELLPSDAGACLMVNLMAAGATGELVVAGRLGDLAGAPSHPLLDTAEQDDNTVRATRTLSTSTDPWITDHSIEGIPVLPGVLGLELMTAAAQIACPAGRYAGARNVRFNAPVKVYGDRATELIIEAELQRPGEVRVRLLSERELRTGRMRRAEHYSATILMEHPPQLDGLPSAFLPDEALTAEQIYTRFFHGPRFQVLSGVFGVSADGLVGEARVDASDIAAGLLTEPLMLEAAFQAAGLHRMLVAHEMGLPLEIEELRVLGAPGPEEPFSLMVQLDGDAYHIDADGLAGPLLKVRGFSMVDHGPLGPEHRFPEPEGGRPTCFAPRRGRVGGPSGATAMADPSDEPSAWLAPDELAELRSRGLPRRVRDRIAGRIAAKRALTGLTGVAPLEIRIDTAPSGAPVARVPGHPDVSVSLSHREGHAVAIAVPSGRIGVDLELVEPRPAHFAATWLTLRERRLCGSDELRQTLVWCAKEAVLKALGTGMALSPHQIEVTHIGADDLSASLTGEVARRHAALGALPLRLAWARLESGEVQVTARMAA